MAESIYYRGFSVEYYPSSGLVSLTNLWKAQQAPEAEKPLVWIQQPATQNILRRIAETENIIPISPVESSSDAQNLRIAALPGKLETTHEHGELRTYATTELAIIYARFLGADCYQWALSNLAEGKALNTSLQEQQIADELASQRRKKILTRRSILAAGWTIPVVTSIALSQPAVAQVTGPHSDAHMDSVHTDVHDDHSDSFTHTDGHTDGHTDSVGVFSFSPP